MYYPSSIKNYLLNDPLIDYLQGHPKYKGKKQGKSKYSSYIESKKWAFTQGCIVHFKGLYSPDKVYDLSEITDIDTKCKKTIEVMNDPNIECIIYGGLKKGNLVASPEIMIRKQNGFHVVETRFSTCHYCKDNKTIRNSDYLWYCKTHVYFMNNLLPKPQKVAYLAVRKIGTETYKENLLEIPMNDLLKKRYSDALDWLFRLQKDSKEWNLDPPSIPELYPNMKVKNEEWDNFKQELAIKNKEISLIWNISTKQRKKLHEKNIYSWDHSHLFNTLQTTKTIPNSLNIQKQFIYVNKLKRSKKPKIVHQENVDILGKKDRVSLFVDFETVMDLDENSSSCSINMTFMIGCVALIDNKPIYKDFTVSKLVKEEEEKIYLRFIEYISRLSNKYNVSISDIPLYHWSNAEKTFYKTAMKKYKLPDVNTFNWIDIYQIFKREPITLKNAWAFGLKNIAKVLYEQGEIKTTWSIEDASDGQDAMIRVIKCNEKALNKNIPLKRFEEMHQIITYNYVDCQVLYEILECLKKF